MKETIFSIVIPLLGTVLGAGCIYFIKKISNTLLRIFSGFAAGVMVAASIWSLIIPAFEASSDMKKLAFIPVVIGVWLGFLVLLLLDRVIPHMHPNNEVEGPKTNLKKSTMTSLAVALHNLPEGIAVGVVLGSAHSSNTAITLTMAIALAVGIAIQNFPEGAIVSISLHSNGVSKNKSFLLGVLSGIVEPLGALLTFAFLSVVHPTLPYLLSFAAGAMLYVVIEELIPDMVAEGKHSAIGPIFFAIGFTMMFTLDVILG